MVRNEADWIADVLDHLAEFCDGVYVFDDASTDHTADFCLAHPVVRDIIGVNEWDPNWPMAQARHRDALLSYVKQDCGPGDWLVYVDADERIEFDWSSLDLRDYDAVVMKLYDFYITREDVDKPYRLREWCGPEYRSIVMAFRARVGLGYSGAHQREVTLKKGRRLMARGSVRHYGKGRGVDAWERKCDFYVKHTPWYAAKWAARRGKAVHAESDFGRPLIRWADRERCGVPLRK